MGAIMNEESKEAVEAFKKAMNLAFEYHYDPPYNAPISECAKVAMEMLVDKGFTIAPIAPVTDEKLREAMNVLRRRCDPNSAYMSGPSPIQAAYLTITDAISELAQLRAASQAVVSRWDGPKWKDLPATAEFINAMRELLPTPPKED